MRALRALQEEEDPSVSLEVLVAEGVRPSRQRNIAATESSGEIIFFLDDDSMVSRGFLSRVVRHFEDPEVSVVGGPSLTPDSDSALQHAFSMVFASIFGGGGMRNRYRMTGDVRRSCDSELILCNLAFRRETFLAHGGFDERLYPNEENELLERITRGGGVLIHDPILSVHRSQRPNLRAFCRQLFGYGRGRGRQTVISGVVRPITFIPSIFFIYLLLLPLVNKAVYYIPLLCYLILVVMTAVFEGLKSGRPRSALFLPLLFPLFHLCYGFGMISGLCSSAKDVPRDNSEVNVRRVKEFEGEWKSGTWNRGAV